MQVPFLFDLSSEQFPPLSRQDYGKHTNLEVMYPRNSKIFQKPRKQFLKVMQMRLPECLTSDPLAHFSEKVKQHPEN